MAYVFKEQELFACSTSRGSNMPSNLGHPDSSRPAGDRFDAPDGSIEGRPHRNRKHDKQKIISIPMSGQVKISCKTNLKRVHPHPSCI